MQQPEAFRSYLTFVKQVCIFNPHGSEFICCLYWRAIPLTQLFPFTGVCPVFASLLSCVSSNYPFSHLPPCEQQVLHSAYPPRSARENTRRKIHIPLNRVTALQLMQGRSEYYYYFFKKITISIIIKEAFPGGLYSPFLSPFHPFFC